MASSTQQKTPEKTAAQAVAVVVDDPACCPNGHKHKKAPPAAVPEPRPVLPECRCCTHDNKKPPRKKGWPSRAVDRVCGACSRYFSLSEPADELPEYDYRRFS